MDIDEVSRLGHLPAGTADILRGLGAGRSADYGEGVSTMTSGHDQHGVAFRFFIKEDKNERASVEAGYVVYDELHMIEWLVERGCKPTERIRKVDGRIYDFLPAELLSFNRFGEVVGGQFAEQYRRFLDGQDAPGTPLRNWDEISPGEAATLEAEGIFTIEQLAVKDRNKIESMSPRYVELLDAAILHENGKDARAAANKAGRELAEQKEVNASLQRQLDELRAMMESGAVENKLVSRSKSKSKAKSRRGNEDEAA